MKKCISDFRVSFTFTDISYLSAEISTVTSQRLKMLILPTKFLLGNFFWRSVFFDIGSEVGDNVLSCSQIMRMTTNQCCMWTNLLKSKYKYNITNKNIIKFNTHRSLSISNCNNKAEHFSYWTTTKFFLVSYDYIKNTLYL